MSFFLFLPPFGITKNTFNLDGKKISTTIWPLNLFWVNFGRPPTLQTKRVFGYCCYLAFFSPAMINICFGFFFWLWAHFHFIHRAMHPWRTTNFPDVGQFLYTYVHSLHHKSYNPTAFSGTSMHPVEVTQCIYLLIVFLIIIEF